MGRSSNVSWTTLQRLTQDAKQQTNFYIDNFKKRLNFYKYLSMFDVEYFSPKKSNFLVHIDGPNEA